MKTFAVTNQKGGVGKTTTTHHLSIALSKLGHRVIAIDLDPQAHLTVALSSSARSGSIYDVLVGTKNAADCIRATNAGVDLIAAEQLLARFEKSTPTGNQWTALCGRLDAIRSSYDFALIDTPPSLGDLSINALVAADAGVLIPLIPEPLSLKGLQHLINTVSEVKPLNPSLEICGLVPTMVHSRWATHSSVLDVLPHVLPDVAVLTRVPEHGSFVRATARRCSIFDLAPRSSGAVAYTELAADLVLRTESVKAA